MADESRPKSASIADGGKRKTQTATTGTESDYVDPSETEAEEEESEEALDITDTHFKYTKIRTQFGKQTQFLEDRPRIHCGLRSNTTRYQPLFQQKSKVNKGEDTSIPLREPSTNTSRAEYRDVSFLHTEGGWTKDVNVKEYESTEKARRKLQREDAFADAVHNLSKEAETLVKHNNTLALCDPINKNPFQLKRDTKPAARVIGVYRCPTSLKRPVSRISFAPGNAGRMAVAYCPYEFDPMFREHNCEAFFWEVENPTRPEGLVRAAAQIADVRYHPSDVHSICGALFTGQVCTWDNRVSPNPQAISDFEVSHEDVCTNAIWCNAEVDTHEFFSAGLDGGIIWWDERNLSRRLKTVYAEAELGKNNEKQPVPVTVLEYDVNDAYKFIVGTQFGHVISFARERPEPRIPSRKSSGRGSQTGLPKTLSKLLALQTNMIQNQDSLMESQKNLPGQRPSVVTASTVRNGEAQKLIMEQHQQIMEELDSVFQEASEVSSETKLEQSTLIERQKSLMLFQTQVLESPNAKIEKNLENQASIMEKQKNLMETHKTILENSQGLRRSSTKAFDVDEEEEDELDYNEWGGEGRDYKEWAGEGEPAVEYNQEFEWEGEAEYDEEEEEEVRNYFDPVAIYTAHRGPVTAIQRNPVYPDYFMSSGGYHLRFYSEAVHNSGIMWTTPSDSLYSYCRWLIGRPSCIVGSRGDGCLEFWDLLIRGSCSILTTKICEEAITCVCPSDNGRHVAAGTINGDIRVVEVCPFMSSFSSSDYDALGQLFQRESRREQHIESRQRGEEDESLAPSRAAPSRESKQPEAEAVKLLAQHRPEKGRHKKPDPFKEEDTKVDKKFMDMLDDEKNRQGVNAFMDKKEAADAYAQLLIEGRKRQKEEALRGTGKDDEAELSSKQQMNINTKTIQKADEFIDPPPEPEEEDSIQEEEDEESSIQSEQAQNAASGEDGEYNNE